jgi:hypothetical protein
MLATQGRPSPAHHRGRRIACQSRLVAVGHVAIQELTATLMPEQAAPLQLGPNQFDLNCGDVGFHGILDLFPLGDAGTGNLFDHDLTANSSKRSEDLIERNIPTRPLDLGDPGLAGLDAVSQLFLGQLRSRALPADGQGRFDPGIKELPLFVGHLEKVGGISEPPACSL